MRKVPKKTPLKDKDKEKRENYAKHGPISNGGVFGCVTLSDDWEVRKKEIAFFDDKPWWLDSSSANNRFWYDFDDESGPPEEFEVDKHSPHFMNLCSLCRKGKVTLFF